MTELSQNTYYRHPFSKAYWKQAAGEIKNTKMLVFAALMIALRVVFKQFSIPVAPDLRINFGFIINALGAAVFGPVIAGLCGAVTDTLGALLFPTGPYFFPFIFVEIASGVLFGMFFYRAKITVKRVIGSRFAIDFLINIVLNTPIMMLYYKMMLGKYYAPVDLVRIVKNLALFPIESVVLIVILRTMIPVFRRLGYVISAEDGLRMTRRNIALIAALVLIGAAAVGGYSILSYNTTSLSASYTPETRLETNDRFTRLIIREHPELAYEDTVAVVESAYPKAFSPLVTYTAAVYAFKPAEEADDIGALRGLSKSKAASSPALTRLFTCVYVINETDGTVVSVSEKKP